MFDRGTLCFPPRPANLPARTLSEKGKILPASCAYGASHARQFSEISICRPRLVFVIAAGNFTKILVQIDCRPVQPQGLSTPDTTEERNGKERNKPRGVFFRCRHNGRYLFDSVKLDFGRSR